MVLRITLAAALVAAVAFALHHPAPRGAIETAALPAPSPSSSLLAEPREARRARRLTPGGDVVVYVAGAVRRPGLYHLQFGDRYARAVELAGGLSSQADAAGVNLAQPAGDGDEVDVPAAGQAERVSPAGAPRPAPRTFTSRGERRPQRGRRGRARGGSRNRAGDRPAGRRASPTGRPFRISRRAARRSRHDAEPPGARSAVSAPTLKVIPRQAAH